MSEQFHSHEELNYQEPQDTEQNLDDLVCKIGKKYGIEHSKLPQLAQFESIQNRNDLITELKNKGATQEEIAQIASYSEQVHTQEATQASRESLGVENNFFEKNIPESMLHAMHNPKRLDEHLLSAVGGIGNLTIECSKIAYTVGKDCIKLPYDLYQLASGQAVTHDFRGV
ncbi:hypothetical protein MK079_04370 [Candidatus Gracilibacteria bacterium]|nr:hypothetical protein [Candidatus Gracilibacteria bacterium]